MTSKPDSDTVELVGTADTVEFVGTADTVEFVGTADTVEFVGTADTVELVVFGAHLRGGPLAHQLTDRGAVRVPGIDTARRYRMAVLPGDLPKPAVTRVLDGRPGSR